MIYRIEAFKKNRTTGEDFRVLVVKITSPNQVLTEIGENTIYRIIREHGFSSSIGTYFYRFEKIDHTGFTKIGEVSNSQGLILRKRRGWVLADSNRDTYKGKIIHQDLLDVSITNPMYFVFYESEIANSFPKIDEIHAFACHKNEFSVSTRNSERNNTFHELGRNLRWYPNAFSEVLNLKFPSGVDYP